MQGRRVYMHKEDNRLHLAEGDYGYNNITGYWQIRPPGCHAGSIPNHGITEHEDRTITVSPSILLTDFNEENGEQIQWHGYLIRGEWKEA